MSEFKIGDIVWYSPVMVLADKRKIAAIRPRKYLQTLYLLEQVSGGEDRRPHWAREDEIDPVAKEIE